MHHGGPSAPAGCKCRYRGWGQIYHETWKQDDEQNIDIHFEHKPGWKHFREGEFVFTLEIEGGSHANDLIKACWRENQSVIRERAPETMQVRSPGRRKYLLKSKDGAYEYEPGDTEAYFGVLQRALEDNKPVADIVDNIIDALPFEEPTAVRL